MRANQKRSNFEKDRILLKVYLHFESKKRKLIGSVEISFNVEDDNKIDKLEIKNLEKNKY